MAARQSMYARAEARREAELAPRATTTVTPTRRQLRRRQLAVLSALWLVIAAVTVIVGVRWTSSSRTPTITAGQSTAAAAPARTATPPRQAAADAASPARTVAAARTATAATPPAPAAKSPAPASKLPASAPKAPVPAPPTATARADAPIAITKPLATQPRVPEVRRTAAVVPAQTAAVPSPDGRLVITSTPPGGRVTVDGVGWGVTPVTIRYLPPGTKHVRITKDGYVSQERAVQIGGSSPASVRFVLPARGGSQPASAGRR